MRASQQGGTACSREARQQLCQQLLWRGVHLRPMVASRSGLLPHNSALAARTAYSSRIGNPASTVFGPLRLAGLGSRSIAGQYLLAKPQQLIYLAVCHNLWPDGPPAQLKCSASEGQQAITNSDAEGTTKDAIDQTMQGEVSAAAAAAATAAAEQQSAAAEPKLAAASHSHDRHTTAAAALARVHQAVQRIQTATAGSPQCTAAAAAAAAGADDHASVAGSSSKDGFLQQQQQQRQLLQPVRPAYDRKDALQRLEQQSSPHPDRLLTWRGKHQHSSTQRQPLQQQQLVHQLQHTTLPPQQQQQQQQQQLIVLSPQQQQQQPISAPPLEPSIGPGGATYLTSPVSFVAADTSTKALAGSLSIAFAAHQHQLMFAVGPHALGVCCKALATARVMLASDNEGRPVHILMQPTLRGGRTARNQSYALDIARVGELPMKPGGNSSSTDSNVVYGAAQQQQQQQGSYSSSSSNSDRSSLREQDDVTADVKSVHITTSSNELAAARSLVENMPARGQTVIRVYGPFATETAVLAVALARPSFRQKYGQDLGVLVMWNQNRMYRKKQSGLLLAVFRCAVGSFPPEVLLLPPSQRKMKRQQYWQRQQQQGRHGK